MAERKTSRLLPGIFQTETNQKFLSATLDQLLSEPDLKNVYGYIGRKFAPTYKTKDSYIVEDSADRQNYQLEPSIIVRDEQKEVTFFASYIDLLNKIKYYGGNISDQSRLFTGEYYSFNPQVSYDKLVNFSQYYWLPYGPDPVEVSTSAVDLAKNFTVSRDPSTNKYVFTADGSVVKTLTLARGGVYTFEVDQPGFPFWIQTELGVDGKNNNTPTISTRSVLGVENNGEDVGTVTFNVPQSIAQDRFLSMETVYNADYAAPLPYSELHNQLLSKFLDRYPQYLGITGTLDGKTLIFVSVDTWTSVGEDAWTARGVFDEAGLQVEGFDSGTLVPEAQRYGVWRVKFVEGGAGDPIIKLVYVQDVEIDEKVYVKYGVANANKEFYKEYTGFFEPVPVISSVQNKLYIQDGVDSDIYDEINLVDIAGYQIDVENDIIGKINYTSPNGVEFTSGLKVAFGTDVIPEAYQNKEYYVENVGDSIKLIDTELMVHPEFYNDEIAVNYPLQKIVLNKAASDTILAGDIITIGSSTIVVDTEVPIGKNTIITLSSVANITKGQTVSGAGIANGTQVRDVIPNSVFPEYITIVRGSKDLNAWSRNNYWFHADVITQTAKYNNQVPYFDQTLRAQRPILQFEGDFQLYNYGRIGKRAIDILDTTTVDAFNQLEGNYYTSLYGINLADYPNGLRVLFANDPDPLVRDKVYLVSLVYTETNPSTGLPVGDPQIKLSIADDGDAEPYDCLVVKAGQYKGSQWHYTGTQWVQSQQKTKLQQDPLFDIVDRNGNSFSTYQTSDFVGSRIFGYKRATSGTPDKVLSAGAEDFYLSYRNFGTQGDIEFTNFYDSETFNYTQDSTAVNAKINTGFMAKIVDRQTLSFRNLWTKVAEPSTQYQLLTFTENTTGVFKLDVTPSTSEATIPYLKVYLNNKLLTTSEYSFDTASKTLTLNTATTVSDKVDVRVVSDEVSALGHYEIPLNLDLNSQNFDLTDLTLGQLRNHLVEISQNSKDLIGQILGYNNSRDLEIKQQGGNILQHAAPVPYAALFLLDKTANLVDAVRYAQLEYTKFKNKFLDLSTSLPGIDPDNPVTSVDLILTTINAIKNRSFPWYYSDMVPYGPLRSVVAEPGYTIFNPLVKSYEISNVFSSTTLSNQAVLVYLNNNQLILGRDYTFDTDRPAITIADTVDLNVDDVLSIYEYSDTDGNYIPETPSKLGLYPKFIPELFLDDTYNNAINVIRGHDGSLTPAFGDYRDDFLLELEKRIYNNIKLPDTRSYENIYNVLPGKFRNNDYTREEISQIFNRSFLNWVGNNKLDYSTNDTFESNNLFSWNYSNFTDRLDGEQLPGGWRAIYQYFYDTDSPHLRPWEMLGFSNKPGWWENYYGPAPYTGGNKLLWDDLEAGRIVEGDRAGIDLRFARPGLSRVIPVDDYGSLLSPVQVLTNGSNNNKTSANWSAGDQGPVETAWRRSSDFPYAAQLALAVSKPAAYFGLLIDTYRYYKQDTVIDQYLSAENHHLDQNFININGDISTGSVVRSAGYLNWIADYLTNLGIDPSAKIKPLLKNYEVNLAYKMAGFSDQKYLQVLAEQSSPTSTNDSIIIPNENYQVYLSKSTPVDKIKYSAVIVEKLSNGYSIRGYDLNNPYFTIIPSIANNNFETSTILDASVKIYKDYQPVKITIPYGYRFTTQQQVVDFFVSYERYLSAQGFVFNELNKTLGQLQNFELSSQEFLFWAQQGWKEGSIIVLSPVIGNVRGITSGAIIDEVSDSQYGSKILDQNFKLVKNTDYTLYRAADQFKIQLDSGQIIGYVELDLVQYEHALIFDNTTVFNDIIYKPELGNRQYRLKIIGQKTGGWDGSLYAPGFIYNSGVVDAWVPGRDYLKGELVQYKDQYYVSLKKIIATDVFDFSNWTVADYDQIKKGLLPNFSSNALKSQSFYDSYGYFNDADSIKYSHGLIGYKPRNYLDELGLNESTQVEFYKGYIKQKGSANAVNALTRAEFNNLNSAISYYEEWAVRVGEYGALDENPYIEIALDEKAFGVNPARAEFSMTNGDGITTFGPDNLYKSTDGYSGNIALIRDGQSDYDNDIPTAGYVNIDDVDATIFDLTDYKILDDNLSNIGSGYTIWVAKDFQQRWNVYRITETNIQIVRAENSLDGYIILETDHANSLEVNDVFMMRNFNPIFDGFYQVHKVLNLKRFMIKFEGNIDELTSIEGNGILFRLDSLRFQYMEETRQYVPPHGWQLGEKVWIDDDAETTAVQGQPYSATNLWKVYERTRPYSLGQRLEKTNDLYITFSNVALSNARATLTIGGNVVSNVSLTTGNAVGIIRNYDIYDANVIAVMPDPVTSDITYTTAILNGQTVIDSVFFNANTTVSNVTINTEYSSTDGFGRSIKMSDNTDTIVVGSPYTAGNVGAVTSFDRLGDDPWNQSSTIAPLANNTSYFGFHLDLAINATDGDKEYMAVGAPYSDKSGSANIGLVYIYSKTVGSNVWARGQIITGGIDGAGVADDVFGYSFAFDEYGHWLYVGAPGNDKTYVYGLKRFVPELSGTNTAPSSTATITIPFTKTVGNDANAFVVTSNTRSYIPNIDFTVTGSVLNFLTGNIDINETLTISQGPYYKLIDVINSTAMGCPVGSEFGYAIDSSLDGAQLGIGAPGATVNVATYSTTIAGNVVTIQKSVAVGTATPTFVVDGVTYNLQSYVENLSAGSVYVVDRVIEAFNSTTSVIYNTVEDIAEVYRVLVDDVEVYEGTSYTKTGAKQITFNVPLGIGKVVTIETNKFTLLEKLISIDSLSGSLTAIQPGARFGTSFTICSNNCAFYVGAPYYDNGPTYNTGAVWKFHNKGRLYGTNFGYARNPTFTPGDTIRLDNFEVTVTGTTLDDLVDDINNANILGVSAINENGYLRLLSDKTVAKNRLRVLSGSGTVYADANMAIFAFMQIIINPFNTPNEYFGTKVILARNAYMLLISSEIGTTRQETLFDENATYFDTRATVFNDAVPMSGSVYTYELYDDPRDVVEHPGRYQYCQQIDPDDLNVEDGFGAAIDIIGGYILVTAPADDTSAVNAGSIYVFENPTGERGWKLIRWQKPTVDIDSVNRLFIYNKNTNTILSNLEFIDPAKGKILGAAEQDITYKTAWDPAVYNQGTRSTVNIQEDIYWGQVQVGQVWWNLDKVRLLDYEQDTLTYRSINWGRFFPGSQIEVCEWVESDVLPSEYVEAGYDGVPLYPDNSAYVSSTFVDSLYVTQRYYFWVKDKTTLDAPNSIRTIPTSTIANLIGNPKSNGNPYAAIIAPNSLIVYNVAPFLSASDTILHVDYATKKNTNIIHSEYELIQKNNPDGQIPEKIIRKFIDSLSGQDSSGAIVPDPTLSVADKYGVAFRPRQSMFVDRISALRTAISWINNLLIDYPVARQFSLTNMNAEEPIPNIKLNEYDTSVATYEELLYVDTVPLSVGHRTLVLNNSALEGRWALYELQESKEWILVDSQSYKTSLYWDYVDWYANGFSSLTKATYVVNTLVDAKKLPYATDDIIRVNNAGDGQWQLINIAADGEFEVVGIQNGTLQLNATKLLTTDTVPSIEIRHILIALRDDIFTGQLSGKSNEFFFVLVNYLLSEQKYVDWIFKTSFINVVHRLRGLTQFPNYIKDNQTYYEEYINEVKPYATKIREYLINYDSNDEFLGSVTDFDLPPYYDTVTKIFRSPSGDRPGYDQQLWVTEPYKQWYDHRAHQIESIIVTYPGVGYTSEPSVSIVSRNGASVEATGKIGEFTITVDNNIGIRTGYKVVGSGIGTNARVTDIQGLTITLDVANDDNVTGVIAFQEFAFEAATAEAIFNADTGEVTGITVLSNGYGYDTTPVIIINGSCEEPARAYAVLKNNQVRSIETTIKFDRVSYTTAVREWAANTVYEAGEIISYNGVGYTVDADITTGATFNSNDYTVYSSADFNNANDRIMAYYSPSDTMPAKDLKQLMYGIEYPGVQVQGLGFDQQPGFTGKALVKLTFDNPVTAYAGNVITQPGPDALISLSGYVSVAEGDTITQRYQQTANAYSTVTATVYNDDLFVTEANTTQVYVTLPSGTSISDFRIDSSPVQINNNTLVFLMDTAANSSVTLSNLTIGGYSITGANVVLDSNKLYIPFVNLVTTPNVAKIEVGMQVSSSNGLYTTFPNGDPRTTSISALAPYPTAVEPVEDANITIVEGGASTLSVVGVMNSTTRFNAESLVAVKLNGTMMSANVVTVEFVNTTDPEYSLYADFNPFDTGSFDQVEYDEDGNPLVSSWLMDTNITSQYTDASLGLRPEDIDVDGGSYVDTYSSHAPEELVPGVVLETLDMEVYTKINANVDVLGYRIFNRSYSFFGNLMNETSFIRIADAHTTVLAANLGLSDTTISVADVSKLADPDPSRAIPGVIFIGGERITYYTKNTETNTLGQIRRGTQTTGTPLIHTVGTLVYDASQSELIPNSAPTTTVGIGANVELILSNVALGTQKTSLTIGGKIVANASITANSNVVSITTATSSNVANIAIGQIVTAANITANTTVTSIQNVYRVTDTPSYKLKVSGNITPKVGDRLTQTTTGANITVWAADPVLTETIELSGNISANVGDYITQSSTGTNVIVTASATSITSVEVEYITGSFETLTGNLAINGVEIVNWANVYSNSSWSNIGSNVTPYVASDRNVTIVSFIYNNANAFAYSNVSLGFSGNISANIGDIITQSGSNANVTLQETVVNDSNVAVVYNSLYDFELDSGNIFINGVDANVRPIVAVANPIDLNSGLYINGVQSNVFPLYDELLGEVSVLGNVNVNSNVQLIVANVWSTLASNSSAGSFERDTTSEQVLFLKAAQAIYTVGLVAEDAVNIITTEDDIIIIEE